MSGSLGTYISIALPQSPVRFSVLQLFCLRAFFPCRIEVALLCSSPSQEERQTRNVLFPTPFPLLCWVSPFLVLEDIIIFALAVRRALLPTPRFLPHLLVDVVSDGTTELGLAGCLSVWLAGLLTYIDTLNPAFFD